VGSTGRRKRARWHFTAAPHNHLPSLQSQHVDVQLHAVENVRHALWYHRGGSVRDAPPMQK
jgi:hypothetical protein